MRNEKIARRRFVQTSAAATGLLGMTLAGCTNTIGELGAGNSPGPDGDRPGWTPYVAASDVFEGNGDVGAFYAFVDFDAMVEFEEFGGFEKFGEFDPENSLGSGRPGDVAFFAFPTLGLVVYVFSLFALFGYPFGDAILPDVGGDDGGGDSDGSGDGTPSGLETNAGLFSQFGLTFVGDYDVDVLAEEAEQFTAVDSRDGFEIFEGGANTGDTPGGFSTTDTSVFAASSDAVLIPLLDTSENELTASEQTIADKREQIDAMIDVLTGSSQNAADADADVDWMLRSSGNGAFGFGGFGDEDATLSPENETESVSGGQSRSQDDLLDEETMGAIEDIEGLLENATGYTSSVELESESTVVAAASVTYDEGDSVPSDEEFEAVYGDTEGEYSIERGETRVYLSSTYET